MKLIRKRYVRMKITDITDIADFIENDTCKIMVGCSRCTYPSIHTETRADTLDHGRLPAVHVSKHVRRNHLVWTPFEAIALPFLHQKNFFHSLGSLGRTHGRTDPCLGRRAGHSGERTRRKCFLTRLNVVRRHYVPVLG